MMAGGFNAGAVHGRIRFATTDWDRGVDKVSGDLDRMKTKSKSTGEQFRAMGRSLSIFGGLLSGAMLVGGRAVVKTGDYLETLNIRLKVLLGSAEAGADVFKRMAEYASEVPFSFEDIMGSATNLAAVIEGGNEQIEYWMRLTGDLAAATGTAIEEATDQIRRMYGAGAASAILFRKRGILEMLGFKAGVQYSAEETRKKLIEMYEDPMSKFRGATAELKTTWTGIASMIGDKWFQLKTYIGDLGLFDYLKARLQMFDDYWAEHADALEQHLETYKDVYAQILKVAAAIGLGATVLGTLIVVGYAAVTMLGTLGAALWAIAVNPVTITLGSLIALTYALRAAWRMNFAGIRDRTQDFVEATTDAGRVIGETWLGVNEDFLETWKWGMVEGAGMVKDFVNQVIAGMQTAAFAIGRIFMSEWELLFDPRRWKERFSADYWTRIFSDIAEEAGQNFGKDYIGGIFEIFTSEGPKLRELGGTIGEIMKEDIDAAIEYLKAKFPEIAALLEDLRNLAPKPVGGEAPAGPTGPATVPELGWGDKFKRTLSELRDSMKEWLANMAEGFKAGEEMGKRTFGAMADNFKSLFSDTMKSELDSTKDYMRAWGDALIDITAEVISQLITLWIWQKVVAVGNRTAAVVGAIGSTTGAVTGGAATVSTSGVTGPSVGSLRIAATATPEVPPVEINNYITHEAIAAAMASKPGERVITNIVYADAAKNGPTRRLSRAGG